MRQSYFCLIAQTIEIQLLTGLYNTAKKYTLTNHLLSITYQASIRIGFYAEPPSQQFVGLDAILSDSNSYTLYPKSNKLHVLKNRR